MKNQLDRIASEINSPCISIALNTHRTHPDNEVDAIVLKKLLKEAEERVLAEYDKRTVKTLLEKLHSIAEEIDSNYNLNSLHLFLSNDTKEIVKSPWPIIENSVHISDRFTIKPLIKLVNRMENYLILVLSQSGVNLFHAVNDTILDEITNSNFPFSKNLHYLTNHDKLSDGKQVDNMVKEYLNTVDKAAISVHHETAMNCVVISTEENYTKLMQVADKPSMYYGYAAINYNELDNKTISEQAWTIVKSIQKQSRKDAIFEMQEAFGLGRVITDLSEIYKAVKEGRGDLLITANGFHQPVKMTGTMSFDLVDDVKQLDVIDDITSEIAWEVISKKGRAIFTSEEELKTLGNIALKVRY